ncbi:galactosyltransferase-related protein [Streptomyces sp. R08]|uniref:Galactosyltransferase-related protein n=1 Tax=Streptomyces sp. R08 TaxID=3238624 RepID=A0AB39MR87_9ACTN
MTSEIAERLASELACGALLVVHEASQHVSHKMWEWCRAPYENMHRSLLTHGGPRIGKLVDVLGARPEDLGAYWAVASEIARELRQRPDFYRIMAEQARLVRTTARIAVHVGDAVPDEPAYRNPALPDILDAVGRAGPRPGPEGTQATIVIPFRAADAFCGRTRNLAACLAALADQTHTRSGYRIVLVESDDRPRWQHLFGGLVDTYLFARKAGRFNKSWAVNCGVVHGGGTDELVCVLDADILIDSDFVARNVARFDDDTLQGFWPYRSVLFADDGASRHAVASRCLQRLPDVRHELLRGTYLRRPPGGCVWLRRSLFDRIAGMDERFEGWGGEDNDFGWRAEAYGGMERFGDHLLHLHHRRGDRDFHDAVPASEAVPWCTWPADSAIGDLRKYT